MCLITACVVTLVSDPGSCLTSVFAVLYCVDVNGTLRVAADLTTECYAGAHLTTGESGRVCIESDFDLTLLVASDSDLRVAAAVHLLAGLPATVPAHCSPRSRSW